MTYSSTILVAQQSVESSMIPIYVINLEGSDNRLRRAAQQLTAHGLSFERIDAVNGRQLSATQKRAFIDDKANRNKFYRPLSDGEIGCYLSHKKCWQALLESQSEYALVLEDDFSLVGDLKSGLAAVLNHPLPVDIVKLCNYQGRERANKFSTELDNTHKLVIHDKPLSGCCAYVISRFGAKQMLAHANKIYRPVDTDIQHTWETGVHVGALHPYPIAQDNYFDSDIASKGRNKPKAYPLQKQWLALHNWTPAYRARRHLVTLLRKQGRRTYPIPATNA
ncbi:glycosyltransferase family 25 protein [Pseudoalteromonas sp. BDTF-M6]|uniref:glycosyltransferase family 25 protein n=1 Tax=Pseudoalteromonas sp. BDTF-M6 TaxID=2796132 RepID=UPI001BB0D112|nr:glycosyltransferase family 25 protein [Pseudoalteromonas sp. BDTF-M6]MBS3797649.1 glycosyltransferase family 25 protein [Pseudoalteromonas sp. BDTF-M6]